MERQRYYQHVDKVELQRRVAKYGKKAQPIQRDWSRSKHVAKEIDLNEAIAILQRSYGNAINREKGWSGRLFKDNCKAKDGWIDEFVTLEKNGKDDYRFKVGTDYGYQCFCYIHNNPVKVDLVKNAVDYKWSSAKDYAGLRKGNLCDLEMGRQLRDFL